MSAPDRIALLPSDGWSWATRPIAYQEDAINYTNDDLIQPQIDAAVKAALEAAARRCDVIAGNTADFRDPAYRRAAGHCASEIRALKDDPALMARVTGKGE